MKHLYDSLRACAKEEEGNAEFCKFFKKKILDFLNPDVEYYT